MSWQRTYFEISTKILGINSSDRKTISESGIMVSHVWNVSDRGITKKPVGRKSCGGCVYEGEGTITRETPPPWSEIYSMNQKETSYFDREIIMTLRNDHIHRRELKGMTGHIFFDERRSAFGQLFVCDLIYGSSCTKDRYEQCTQSLLLSCSLTAQNTYDEYECGCIQRF